MKKRQYADSTTGVIHQAIDTLAPIRAEKPPLLISSLRSLFEGEVPNLFDWYIGMVSIMLGCSMFLFNTYLSSHTIAPYLVWLIPIRVSFIAAGISVLMLGFVKKERTGHYRSMHILLSLTYLVFSLILLQTGDWDGGILYGLTGLTIILTFLLGTGGVVSFFGYSLLLLAILPISLAAGKTPPPLSAFLSFLHVSIPAGSAVWLIIVGCIALGTLGSYRRHRTVFTVSLALVIAGHLLLSLWYGANMAWGQSLLLALLSAMMLLVPQWRLFPFEQRWTKIIICSTCLGVFLVLTLGLCIIHLMQNTMVGQAKDHLTNTATYGGMVLTTTCTGIRSALESMAQNPSVLEAIVQRDDILLSGLSRSLLEANHTMLLVGFLDTNGQTISMYPSINTGALVLSDEPFFRKALSGSTTYSTITEMHGKMKTPVLAIATPIRSSENTVIGAAVGMVDLYALTDLLQQSAVSEKEQSITVTDNTGRLVIHPNITLIGTTALAAERNHSESSVVQGHTDDGRRVMQASAALSPLSMHMTVMQPMATVLPVGVMVSFLMVCTAIVYLMIMSMNMFIYSRREVLSDQPK